MVRKRLPVDHRHPGSRHEVRVGDVAQPAGVGGIGPADGDGFPDGHFGERHMNELSHRTIGPGNGVAVGIDPRMPERVGHALDQHIGDGVFQPFRLVVHRVPGVVEKGDEIGLDEAVAP